MVRTRHAFNSVRCRGQSGGCVSPTPLASSCRAGSQPSKGAPAGRSNQMLSFFFSSSLTACGLALPPVDFMTWPTNQPSIVGLALRRLHLVGVGGDHGVDCRLDGAGVGDLLEAPLLDDLGAGRRPRSRRSRTVPWRSCPRSRPMAKVDDAAELRRRYRDALDRPCRPCSARPNSSLITQLRRSACRRGPWPPPRSNQPAPFGHQHVGIVRRAARSPA